MGVSALDQTLAALADPERRRMVDLLKDGPRSAGDLAAGAGVSRSLASRHLKILKAAGLVADAHPDFDARVRIYSLRAGPMRQLAGWLEAAETGWIEQLAAFKAHVEGGG